MRRFDQIGLVFWCEIFHRLYCSFFSKTKMKCVALNEDCVLRFFTLGMIDCIVGAMSWYPFENMTVRICWRSLICTIGANREYDKSAGGSVVRMRKSMTWWGKSIWFQKTVILEHITKSIMGNFSKTTHQEVSRWAFPKNSSHALRFLDEKGDWEWSGIAV